MIVEIDEALQKRIDHALKACGVVVAAYVAKCKFDKTTAADPDERRAIEQNEAIATVVGVGIGALVLLNSLDVSGTYGVPLWKRTWGDTVPVLPVIGTGAGFPITGSGYPFTTTYKP